MCLVTIIANSVLSVMFVFKKQQLAQLLVSKSQILPHATLLKAVNIVQPKKFVFRQQPLAIVTLSNWTNAPRRLVVNGAKTEISVVTRQQIPIVCAKITLNQSVIWHLLANIVVAPSICVSIHRFLQRANASSFKMRMSVMLPQTVNGVKNSTRALTEKPKNAIASRSTILPKFALPVSATFVVISSTLEKILACRNLNTNLSAAHVSVSAKIVPLSRLLMLVNIVKIHKRCTSLHVLALLPVRVLLILGVRYSTKPLLQLKTDLQAQKNSAAPSSPIHLILASTVLLPLSLAASASPRSAVV
jgi:hypothetical protein